MDTVYVIRNRAGQPLAHHIRSREPSGRKRYHWELPTGELGLGPYRTAELPLYGIERLAGWAGPLFVVEGEKAADALWEAGYLGLGTVTGASATPGPGPLGELPRARRLYLWPDHDAPGRQHMQRIADRLLELGYARGNLRVIEAPGAGPGHDAADYLAADGSLHELVESATLPALPPPPPRRPAFGRQRLERLQEQERVRGLRTRVDLVALIGREVPLRKAGEAHKGLCPFHGDRATPSLTVWDDGHYHCFGCGAHGDALDWLMQSRGIGFKAAVAELSGLAR